MAGPSHRADVIGASRPAGAGSAGPAMRAQEFRAALGEHHPDAGAGGRLPRDVAAIDRILPDRQSRARGAQVSITSA